MKKPINEKKIGNAIKKGFTKDKKKAELSRIYLCCYTASTYVAIGMWHFC